VNQNFEPVAGLEVSDIQASQLVFAVSKEAMGFPERVNIQLISLDDRGRQVFDAVPDEPRVGWLLNPSPHLSVPAGSPQPLLVGMDFSHRPDGDYAAKLLLETNDPDRPVVEIPISVHVGPVIPVYLSGFEAHVLSEGVKLSWQTNTGISYLGFDVYRQEIGPLPADEIRLTTTMLPPNPDGAWEFVDATAEAGREYLYRLGGWLNNGSQEFSDPLYVRMQEGDVPAALWLGAPSPNPASHSATIRYAIPDARPTRLAIFAVDGGRVRLLREGPRAAGFYAEVWNGRDDDGRTLPAGVYFIRLEAGRMEKTQKLGWIR
jgi:hypothetical protein